MCLCSQHSTGILVYLSESCCSAQGHLLPNTFFLLLEVCTITGVLVTLKSNWLWFLTWRQWDFFLYVLLGYYYAVFSYWNDSSEQLGASNFKKLPTVLNQVSLLDLLNQKYFGKQLLFKRSFVIIGSFSGTYKERNCYLNNWTVDLLHVQLIRLYIHMSLYSVIPLEILGW